MAPATACTSSGHAGLGCRLMPMPTTSELTVPVSPSMVASVRMPHSLRPFISTSFTHLICGVKPAVCSMARTTAIAAEMVTNDRCDSGSKPDAAEWLYTPGVGRGDECAAEPSASAGLLSANSVKPLLAEISLLFVVVSWTRWRDGSTRISRPMTAVSSSALMPAAVRLSSSGGQAIASGHGVTVARLLAQCGRSFSCTAASTRHAASASRPPERRVPRACSSACKTASFTVNSIISTIKMLIYCNEKEDSTILSCKTMGGITENPCRNGGKYLEDQARDPDRACTQRRR